MACGLAVSISSISKNILQKRDFFAYLNLSNYMYLLNYHY